MIVFIDERETVRTVFGSWFAREGAVSVGLSPEEFGTWFDNISDTEGESLDAVLFGQSQDCDGLPAKVRRKSRAAVLALVESPSLEHTLNAFRDGVDDVVKKPVHVRELLARIDAIRLRRVAERGVENGCKVFAGGGDPVIGGMPLPLPRRERKILEFLARNEGRRVSKTQLFNAVYGMFDSAVDESIVESHISKLRRKLRELIGYDPIDSKRFLGYLFELRPDTESANGVVARAKVATVVREHSLGVDVTLAAVALT
jgi:two-component system, OmpR family, flagellar system response regulator FtcR